MSIKLPSRCDLETPHSGGDMIALAKKYLSRDGDCAISDDQFFSRSPQIIKTMLEEYMPLSYYVASMKDIRTTGCLAKAGSSHDAIVRHINGGEESIQIVHGTECHSESLRREMLGNGEFAWDNCVYSRDSKTRSPKIELQGSTSPMQWAKTISEDIVKRIKCKIAKNYKNIDTLLVTYAESMSTDYTQCHDVVTQSIKDWIRKNSSCIKPFKRIVLVSDRKNIAVIAV